MSIRKSNMLQIGKAGEYLVCADLILKGYIAFFFFKRSRVAL